MATTNSAADQALVPPVGNAAPSTTFTPPVEQPMTPAQALAFKRRWVALILLSLTLLMIVADSTIVNIAFPSIRKTFGASYADAEWINSIYSLFFAAFLITFGKLGDQFGRRNIFVGGAIVFLLGSIGTGFAPNIGFAIGARALQGLGGAMMSPSTLSIISSTFKGRERGIAFGVWGATAGVAGAVGPIVGGWLITNGGGIVNTFNGLFTSLGISADNWRLAFLINAPIGIIAIAGSIWAIREGKLDRTIKHKIDVLGILLASLALGFIVFGAIEGQNYGWLQQREVLRIGPIIYPQLADSTLTTIPAGMNVTSFIPVSFVIGAIFLALFVLWELRQERRDAEPVFEFGLLKYRSFRFGLITIMIVALGEFGIVLALSIYLQLARGLDAFHTGLAFLPFAIVILIVAPSAGILSARFGAKWIVTAGMLIEALAMFLTSRTLYVNVPDWQLVAVFAIYGAGIGLAIAQTANIVLSDIPREKTGVASGATNTIRQVGSTIGIAIIGAVLFGSFATNAKPLIASSTAFTDFGAAVKADKTLSAPSRLIANEIVSFEATAKQAISDGLDANTGFDSNNSDTVQTAIDNTPAFLKTNAKLDDPTVVAKVKTELKPYADQLTASLQNSLAVGFSQAARTSALVAMFFILLGAISSLQLPNNKAPQGSDAPVAAH